MTLVLGLQGVFDPATKNFGYNLLVANGTSDKPDYTPYKWFYGDVYGLLLDISILSLTSMPTIKD